MANVVGVPVVVGFDLVADLRDFEDLNMVFEIAPVVIYYMMEDDAHLN